MYVALTYIPVGDSADRVFTDLLWALAENSAQTDQVKQKSAQRKQHYLRAKTDLLWGA